jgi:hypothetical protein
MDVWDGIIQLTITFFGVFLGFELSKWWDKSRHKNEQKGMKKTTIESLLTELDTNKSLLNKQINVLTDQFNPHTLLTGAFNTSIHSGNFYLFEVETQKNLQTLYSKFDELRLLSELMFSLITPDLLSQGTPYQIQVKSTVDQTLKTAEKNRDESLRLLETVKENLNKELSYL